MMILGLVSAVIGLAVAYAYSSVLGALLFLIGAALLARGYLKPEPEAPSDRKYEAAGSITYDISSKR